MGVAALAVVWRLVRADLGAPPNLELVTASAFAAAMLLRHRVAVLVPLAVAVVSDLLLGSTLISLFTWSAWAVTGAAALLAPRLSVRRATRRSGGAPAPSPARRRTRRLVVAAGFGVGASLWFFLWTNAGVWWQWRGTTYAAGLDGLLASYAAGLPFLRTMLLGNLVLVPLAAVLVALVERSEARRAQPSRPVPRSAAMSPVAGVPSARP